MGKVGNSPPRIYQAEKLREEPKDEEEGFYGGEESIGGLMGQ